LRLRRVVKISAVAGLLVPVIFTGLFALLEFTHLIFRPALSLPFVISRLLLWPTSIGLLALDGSPNWSFSSLEFVLLLAVLNVPIYVALGTLGWAITKGLRKLA